MPEARAPKESEVQEVIGFLNKHLRPNTDWSIASEYPFVFHPNNRDNLRIITDNDHQVLAHAATKYLVVKSTAGLFKVAAIGSVLTAPEHRGQGLSQEVLKSAIEAATNECADFAILWTDLYDLYRKVGFELAGTEYSVVIDQPMNLPPTDLRFVKSEKVDPEAILRLFSKHTCSTIRTAEEVRRNLQIPNSRVYTAWASDNRLVAYAIEGKGADLKGYIHEWGGGVQELMQLLGFVRNDIGQPITILMPEHSYNLRKQLQPFANTIHQGYLGMIRPVATENFFMKIRRHARNLGIADFLLEQRGEKFVVGTQTDFVTLNSINELTRLMFGPIDVSLLKPEFQKIFPIPMWIWGWDSV